MAAHGTTCNRDKSGLRSNKEACVRKDQITKDGTDPLRAVKAKRPPDSLLLGGETSKRARIQRIAGSNAAVPMPAQDDAASTEIEQEMGDTLLTNDSRRVNHRTASEPKPQNATGSMFGGSRWDNARAPGKVAAQAAQNSPIEADDSSQDTDSDSTCAAPMQTFDATRILHIKQTLDALSTPSENFNDTLDVPPEDGSSVNESHLESELLTCSAGELYSENLSLRSEVARLKLLLYPSELPPRSRIVYRVICDCREPIQVTYYDDCPTFTNMRNSNHVAGRSISRVKLRDGKFVSCGSNVVLLILKNYYCRASKPQFSAENLTLPEFDTKHSAPKQWSESMAIIKGDDRTIFKDLLAEAGVPDSLVTGLCDPLTTSRNDSEVYAPYAFFHHNRDSFMAGATSDKFKSDGFLKVIVAYLETFQPDFEYADTLAKQGKVCLKTIHYLFKAGQVIVKGPLNSESLAFCTDSYLEGHPKTRSFKIKAWCWRYDGRFWRDRRSFDFEIPHLGSDEVISLSDLEFQPLEYTPQEFQEDLRRRGLRFWKCRQRQFVRYESKLAYEVRMNDTRYMIDYGAQGSQRPDGPRSLQASDSGLKEYLPFNHMNDIHPPEGSFVFLLPSQIFGFHMLNKKWEVLNVSGVSDVEWNKKAFENLVVDPETKEFVQALVTQHLPLETSTDLMEGKGNSLVILLHGGPGTGKTLTAESVAELAEKPLYRVTCGDIGTDPVAVERHLRSVLYLGKVWGCVVLLDEADVFLEERKSHDMNRNALVSCFLRALEYYDGILILTTNRVGTFDEAFKSRIQLSLRYKNLTEQQRLRIWENFFHRLQDIDEDRIDVADLRRHSRDLAKHQMNGRQIRNCLTNARQLAAYKGERMGMAHIRRAIDAFVKFEEYTKEINQGITDDDLARDSGIR